MLIEANTGNEISFYLKQRDKKDIWKNLYDFPMLESESRKNPIEVLENPSLKALFTGQKFSIKSISDEYRHQLTHQNIHAVFIWLIVDKNSEQLSEKSILLVDQNELINYPVPRLLERYLQDQKILK